MELPRFEKDMNIIQKLSDEPNERDGLTAGELKAKFDEGGLALKDYLNNTVKPNIEAYDTVVQALEAADEREAASRQAEEARLQAQIDELVAPSGEAPSAAEVENARVGADATVYPTLGEAIRGQVVELKNLIINNLYEQYNSSKKYIDGEYCIYAGNLYRCISPITTGQEWTSANWAKVDVMGELDPINQIIDGITIRTGNLYDNSPNHNHIGFFDSQGAVVSSGTSAAIASQYNDLFIAVNPDTNYCWGSKSQGITGLCICTYDKNKSFVDRLTPYANPPYTTTYFSDNIKYIRLCYYNHKFPVDFMFCEGKSVPESYIEGYVQVNSDAIYGLKTEESTVIELVSGTNFEISDGSKSQIKSLIISFSSEQSGAGEPSPINVRPIRPRTAVDCAITTGGKPPKTVATTWSYGVYGGTLDIISGKLIETHKSVTYNGSETWTALGGRYYRTLSAMSLGSHANDPKAKCNLLPIVEDQSNYPSIQLGFEGNTIASVYLNGMGEYGISSVAELKAWLAENPITIVYPLKTPIEHTLDGQSVGIENGTSHFETSEILLQVEYRADLALYIKNHVPINKPSVKVRPNGRNRFIVDVLDTASGKYITHSFRRLVSVDSMSYGSGQTKDVVTSDVWYSDSILDGENSILQGNTNFIHSLNSSTHSGFVGASHGCVVQKNSLFFVDGQAFDPDVLTQEITGNSFTFITNKEFYLIDPEVTTSSSHAKPVLDDDGNPIVEATSQLAGTWTADNEVVIRNRMTTILGNEGYSQCHAGMLCGFYPYFTNIIINNSEFFWTGISDNDGTFVFEKIDGPSVIVEHGNYRGNEVILYGDDYKVTQSVVDNRDGRADKYNIRMVIPPNADNRIKAYFIPCVSTVSTTLIEAGEPVESFDAGSVFDVTIHRKIDLTNS